MREVIVVGLAVGAIVTSGCRDPTQITLTIRTDAACSDVAGTAISVGDPNQVEDLAPVATTSSCSPDPAGGDIGSLVLVPADADDAAVGVKVTLSVAETIESCLAPPYDECVVARRSLRYIAHTPLTLPVELNLACKGQFCAADTTCVDGRCVDSNVDPNECANPAGCEPEPVGGGGAGGEGGAGGGPASCDSPMSKPPEAITNTPSEARSHLVMAANPSTCGWGVAWGEGTRACFQAMRSDGKTDGGLSCQDIGNTVDDVAVAALGSSAFAVAGWSSAGKVARLWAQKVDAGAPATSIALDGVVSGTLAARAGTLVLVYHQENQNALRFRKYTYNGELVPDIADTPLGVAGQLPHGKWSGTDFMLSWLNSPGQSGGRIVRGALGSNMNGAVTVDAASEIVMADHEPDHAVGIHFQQPAMAATLDIWGANGFVSGTHSATGSATAQSFTIAGTATGWVVGFVDFGQAWLTPFDANGVNLVAQKQLASSATSVAVAAIGDQLAVGWIDASSAIHFQLIDAGLANL